MSKFLFAVVILIYLIPGCIAVMVHNKVIPVKDGQTDIPVDSEIIGNNPGALHTIDSIYDNTSVSMDYLLVKY